MSYTEDGRLVFLGRIDDQVKVRSNRIELGEVQGILGEHPDVKDATVVVSKDDFGDAPCWPTSCPARVVPRPSTHCAIT